MPFRRIVGIIIVAFAVTSLTGCGGPDVRSYAAPKPQPVPEGFGFRILGAMVPAEEPVWFFKLTGLVSDVAEQEATFDAFLATVTFPEGPGKNPKWTVPAGMREGPPREFRFATLLIGAGSKPLELTISEAKGGKAANLQRWAGQLGLESVPGETVPIQIGGIAALKVTMNGPKNPSAGGMMGRR